MLKHIRNILFIFIGIVVVGYLSLVCVYALPTEPISRNVAEASNIMQMDGSHPELIYGHQDTMLDNLTDSIICYGVACYIFLHVVINLTGILGILPLTGVPLPFLSYGGSFALTLAIGLALVQRVSIENYNF